MKKILAIALVCVMALSIFAGCAGTNNPTTTGKPADGTTGGTVPQVNLKQAEYTPPRPLCPATGTSSPMLTITTPRS